ncbi:DUF805 domain-containing protein [Phenylobacterium terrae]|uniref:DUF805 domain-containing protein n=1 Tax=Phenylobacterium terrae TaxID=2665495 RepID=A0ABW4N347_9CAUL
MTPFVRAYFRIDGRIGRGHYWLGWLLVLGLSWTAELLPADWGDVARTVLNLLLLFPQVCMLAQRLHDVGRSGWWQLAPMGGALGLAILWMIGAAALGVDGEARNAWGAALAILLVVGVIGFYIWLGLAKGEPEANAWGPPPGARSPAEDADVFA